MWARAINVWSRGDCPWGRCINLKEIMVFLENATLKQAFFLIFYIILDHLQGGPYKWNSISKWQRAHLVYPCDLLGFELVAPKHLLKGNIIKQSIIFFFDQPHPIQTNTTKNHQKNYTPKKNLTSNFELHVTRFQNLQNRRLDWSLFRSWLVLFTKAFPRTITSRRSEASRTEVWSLDIGRFGEVGDIAGHRFWVAICCCWGSKIYLYIFVVCNVWLVHFWGSMILFCSTDPGKTYLVKVYSWKFPSCYSKPIIKPTS